LKKAYELCRDIDEKDIPIVALTLELTDFSIKLYGDRIVIDPEIRHGKPVIKGTRAQKDIIPGSLAGGMTVEEVAREYGIEKEDIMPAIEYATKIVAREEIKLLHA